MRALAAAIVAVGLVGCVQQGAPVAVVSMADQIPQSVRAKELSECVGAAVGIPARTWCDCAAQMMADTVSFTEYQALAGYGHMSGFAPANVAPGLLGKPVQIAQRCAGRQISGSDQQVASAVYANWVRENDSLTRSRLPSVGVLAVSEAMVAGK